MKIFLEVVLATLCFFLFVIFFKFHFLLCCRWGSSWSPLPLPYFLLFLLRRRWLLCSIGKSDPIVIFAVFWNEPAQPQNSKDTAIPKQRGEFWNITCPLGHTSHPRIRKVSVSCAVSYRRRSSLASHKNFQKCKEQARNMLYGM